MAYALNDIKSVAGIEDSEVNLLAYFDSNARDVPTLYCDFTDTNNPQYVPTSSVKKRFKHKGSNENDQPPSDEENSAAMYSVMNFADWCVNKAEYESNGKIKKGRQSKNYAMIFSGHGFGFQSITLLKDNDSDYYMTIRKLRAALERINDEIIPTQLAILGFDSCVMSMLEVGYELRKVAKTMIASEGTIPNAGWTYEPILKEIAKKKIATDDDIFAVSKGIVRSFINIQEKFAIGGVSVDLSAWNLKKVEPVVVATNKLGEILLKGLQHKTLSSQLELVLLKCHYKSQSYMFEQNVDLVDFCKILKKEAKQFGTKTEIYLDSDEGKHEAKPFTRTLVKICDEIIKNVKDCILLNGFSGGKFQYSDGVSVFFPWTYLVYVLSMETYNNLRFVYFKKGRYWRDFLFHYLGEVSLRGRTKQIGEVIQSIETKTTENAKTRTTENPKTRTTENPKTRLVEDFAGVRVIENPATKTTENPKTRTTENPKTRLLDGTGSFLYDYKNVATPWFVAGFNGLPKKSKQNEDKKEEHTD